MKFAVVAIVACLAFASCTGDDEPDSTSADPTVTTAPDDASSPAPSDEEGGGGKKNAVEGESATVEETDSDATSSGEVGTYVELSSASISADASSFKIDLGFLDDVPERMASDQEQMLVTVSLTLDAGGRYSLNALGTASGWAIDANGTTGAPEFPGDFAFQGSDMQIQVPWSEVGGPQRFRWIASSAWSATDRTAYAFDAVPDGKLATFP